MANHRVTLTIGKPMQAQADSGVLISGRTKGCMNEHEHTAKYAFRRTAGRGSRLS
jgi:hypothetical protein